MPSRKSKLKYSTRYDRWAQTHKWFRDGWTVEELASELDVSRRLVRKILNKDLGFRSRPQALKELLPGLNALFGLEYSKLESEHSQMEAN
jgi:transcriptional regulator with XRE-family HTH domain